MQKKRNDSNMLDNHLKKTRKHVYILRINDQVYC